MSQDPRRHSPSEYQTKLDELCDGLGVRRPELHKSLGIGLRNLWCIYEADVTNESLVFQIVQGQLEWLISNLDANRTDIDCKPLDKDVARVLFNISLPGIGNRSLMQRYDWCDSEVAQRKYKLPPGNSVRGPRWRLRIMHNLAEELSKNERTGNLLTREEALERIEARPVPSFDKPDEGHRAGREESYERPGRSFGNIGTYIKKVDTIYGFNSYAGNDSTARIAEKLNKALGELTAMSSPTTSVEAVEREIVLARQTIINRDFTQGKRHLDQAVNAAGIANHKIRSRLIAIAEEVEALDG